MEHDTPSGATPLILKSLFFLMTFLILASAGYAFWIVVAYWDLVGV